VDPICPLLTLGGDRRVVSGSPDAAHRCAAGGTLTPIERDYQSRFCLTGRHETCERYLAHVEQFGPLGPAWRGAAPDATFASTRLVVDAAPRSLIGPRPRRIGTAALIVLGLVLAGVLVAWIGLGGLAAILGPSPTPRPSATSTASLTPEPSASVEPSASASIAPTPTPGPTPTPAPTPVTYIVQAGDTLNAIAARFGTTAQAIRDANGLTSDIIQVGQILIIPIP
jgi:LysM repeat protein